MDKKYLTVKQLSDMFVGTERYMSQKLVKMLEIKKIKKYMCRFNKKGIFLDSQYVDLFQSVAGLEKRIDVEDKGNDWLSAGDLLHVVPVGVIQISDLLYRLKDNPKMKEKIQFKRTSKGRYVSLCLRKDGLKQFKKICEKCYNCSYDWGDVSNVSDDQMDLIANRLTRKYSMEKNCLEVRKVDSLLSEIGRIQSRLTNIERDEQR